MKKFILLMMIFMSFTSVAEEAAEFVTVEEATIIYKELPTPAPGIRIITRELEKEDELVTLEKGFTLLIEEEMTILDETLSFFGTSVKWAKVIIPVGNGITGYMKIGVVEKSVQ